MRHSLVTSLLQVASNKTSQAALSRPGSRFRWGHSLVCTRVRKHGGRAGVAVRSDASQQFDGFAQTHFIRQNAASDLQVWIMTGR